ncbi:MAG TPA: ChbG/HpnK family deacetylase [Longimicrobiaceae bacterium]|nr:ChbG/HpnK family deacetylase [Longimicrobiaceae bacterium]
MKPGTSLVALALTSLLLAAPGAAQARSGPELVLRLDDIGGSHAINMAMKEVADRGIPFSTSVLFVGPWYQEAVEILKQHPNVSVGVHLALNSEWKDYRWGPVLGQTAVPSLVDSVGYFRHSVEEFLGSKYDLGEVERELEAQVQRALRSGLKIDYVDFHMGTAASTPQLRAVVERIAKRHDLGISYYFGEDSNELWGTPVAQKMQRLQEIMKDLKPDQTNLLVFHVMERTPASDALIDMNAPSQNIASGGDGVSRHRHAELEALLSPQFAAMVKDGGVHLVTYRELIAEKGLASMHAPSAQQ